MADSFFRRVLPTMDRSMVERDFIVQLSKKDDAYARLKKDKWLILVKAYPAYKRDCDSSGNRLPGEEHRNEVRVKARLVWLDDDDELDALADGDRASIRMDETLRVALGIFKSEEIEKAVRKQMATRERDGVGVSQGIQNTEISEDKNVVKVMRCAGKRSFRRSVHNLVSSLIGVQPRVMRVHRAHFKDMEMSICRIDETIFDSLGIAPGDFVDIESVAKVDTEERLSRTRALPLNKDHIKTRCEEQKNSENETQYPDNKRILGLGLLASEDSDLPWIFMDFDERCKLDVCPGDVVRVCRSANRLLWKRAFLLATPLLLGVVSWVYTLEKLDPVGMALVLGGSLLALFVVVIKQLQRQIS